MQKNPWKKLSSKTVYKNQWIKVIEDKVIRPDGKQGMYAYVETNGHSVYVMALTNKNEVYLVGLFRYTSGEYSWELPGGNCEGEDVLKAAKRELLEETGFEAKRWREAGYFWVMNGIVKEKSFVFVAKELKQSQNNEMKEEGISAIRKMPFTKVLSMIGENKITDGQSIAAILKAKLFLKI